MAIVLFSISSGLGCLPLNSISVIIANIAYELTNWIHKIAHIGVIGKNLRKNSWRQSIKKIEIIIDAIKNITIQKLTPYTPFLYLYQKYVRANYLYKEDVVKEVTRQYEIKFICKMRSMFINH